MRIRPARPLITGLAITCLLALASSLLRDVQAALAQALNWAGGSVLLALLLTALWDAFRQRTGGELYIQRQLPVQFVQGQAHEIHLLFSSPSGRFWRQPRVIRVADLHPSTWQTDTPLLTLNTIPGRRSQMSYHITPMNRGQAHFEGIEYWLPSILGFWQCRHRQAAAVTVAVLPDFSRILGAELVSLQRWLNWVGVKKIPQQGRGQDFHQLRDYQQGDDIRHIDWKATARMNKAIVRSFQQERDQQVIFLLDCGRNMRLHMNGLSHFDHSLQAMLLLSFTALRHGDAVGLFTFAHPQPRFVPPHKRLTQINHLVQGVYDIEPSLQAGDLESAVSLLLQKQRRRALVVVLTHLNHDDVNDISAQLLRLQRHHLVLLASLRPQVPDKLLAEPVHDQDSANAYLGAWQYRQQADQLLQQLQLKNIPSIHTLPSQLSSGLINRYLGLKRRQAW